METHDRKLVKTSKFLSLILRHKPEVVGVQLGKAGWTPVEELLAKCAEHGRLISREQLEAVVRTNDKKRFEMNADRSMIRASQGHSVDVDLGYEPMAPPEILYHGTATRNLASIRRTGLQKGQRHHVHLSADARTAANVGQRYGKPVVLHVRAGLMAQCGITFYRSTNGVWLTDEVAPEYLVLPDIEDI